MLPSDGLLAKQPTMIPGKNSQCLVRKHSNEQLYAEWLKNKITAVICVCETYVDGEPMCLHAFGQRV